MCIYIYIYIYNLYHPVLEIQQQDRNGKLVELKSDEVLTKAEFSMGWAGTGLKGMKDNGRPNKCGSKGKQKIKRNVFLEGSETVVSNKEALGLSEGSWKRRARQSPSANMDQTMSVDVGMKRKYEGSDRDLMDVNMHEKKKKVTEENNVAETAEVAGQPRRDQ